MKSVVSIHQLGQIFDFIKKDYRVLGTKEENGKPIFGEISSAREILIPTPKTILPFKKLIYPAILDLAKTENGKPVAFFGMTNCDAEALCVFLDKFKDTGLVPPFRNILVISTTCVPDENCFCTAFGNGKITNFDLHITKEKDQYAIFSGSALGRKILKLNRIKVSNTISKPTAVKLENVRKIQLEKLGKAIDDKTGKLPFWQEIADECFGCGACTAVCPLCFCTGKDFENDAEGGCKHCLKWDSCYAKSFSEIQNHFDLRPSNVNRLYNWYHHKFVRSPKEDGEILCTGCGRCIKACPAYLNQHRIIETVQNYTKVIDKSK
ncbi:MAG: 4Fe-4S dicluster domain-containing protein [Candidatus Berkelbacteria bacterium]|nr:4Fe-4S dicluster domain-containing protein [Candidatus Berkelbacteria bacterium]